MAAVAPGARPERPTVAVVAMLYFAAPVAADRDAEVRHLHSVGPFAVAASGDMRLTFLPHRQSITGEMLVSSQR